MTGSTLNTDKIQILKKTLKAKDAILDTMLLEKKDREGECACGSLWPKFTTLELYNTLPLSSAPTTACTITPHPDLATLDTPATMATSETLPDGSLGERMSLYALQWNNTCVM